MTTDNMVVVAFVWFHFEVIFLFFCMTRWVLTLWLVVFCSHHIPEIRIMSIPNLRLNQVSYNISISLFLNNHVTLIDSLNSYIHLFFDIPFKQYFLVKSSQVNVCGYLSYGYLYIYLWLKKAVNKLYMLQDCCSKYQNIF